MNIRRIETMEQLSEAVGMKIEISGHPKQAKAGVYIEFDGLHIWCRGIEMHDFLAKRVRIVGLLQRGASPLQDFPVATKDHNGAWSQGVTVPASLKSNFLGLEVGTQEQEVEKLEDWLINIDKIVDHSAEAP